MSTEASVGYSIARREEALDFMAQWPGYGEQRARDRAGVVQLAAHAARDGRSLKLRPPPSWPRGGLLRDLGHGHAQGR